MLSNLIIGGLFTAFVAFHFYTERTHTVERKRLVDAVLAKNTSEFLALQKPVPAPRPADFIEPEKIFAEGF